MPDQTPRDYVLRRVGALNTERSTFDAHWKELAQFIQPRRGRFFTQDRNKGEKRHQSIINSRATQAHKIARSGLLAGIMSPARPWFALETPDPKLMEFQPVKVWLHAVELILREIFNGSNLYNMAPTMLGETLLFATGSMTQVDDFEDVARFYTHTAGSYMLGQSDRFEVDTLAREFEMTVAQMVGKFGLENCSTTVRNAYSLGNYDAWIPVTQLIEPNKLYRGGRNMFADKPFVSLTFEPGGQGEDKDKWLERQGYLEFPSYCPRWETTGEDIYGTDCPAITALGDIKGMQIKEKRKAQAIDKLVNPPLQGPASLRNVPITSLPGGVNIFDSSGDKEGLRPVYQVNPQVAELMADIQSDERRINEAFFVDLFKPITMMEGIQPKNELDLSQRHSEAMIQLGPVLENFHGEFLSRMIDRTFNQAVRAGILPTPPEELQGKPLRVRYISVLAMAQRAVATGTIDRLAGFIGGLMQAGLTDGKKFDGDQAIDEYASITGAPPRIVVPDDVVAQRRADEQRMMQAQQAAELAQSGANTVKLLADSKTGEENVLSNMAGR